MYWSIPYEYMNHNFLQAPEEKSINFFEQFLREKINKNITVYMRYGDNQKIFTGKLKQAGRDFFILEEVTTKKDVALLIVNLDYVVLE